MDNFIRDLVGIKDPTLKFDPRFTNPTAPTADGALIIHLMQTYPMTCPLCGRPMLKNGFQTVDIKGYPQCGTPAILRIRKQKYLCRPDLLCPRTVTKIAAVMGINHRHRIANAVRYRVVQELHTNQSCGAIAQRLSISTTTVLRVLRLTQSDLQVNHNWLPRAIALDDFKGGPWSTSEMSMVLVNPENDRLLDVLRSRKNDYLTHYFNQYPLAVRQRVLAVVVDLYDPYRSLIKQLFPHAVVIADCFHIVGECNRALQNVRRQAIKAHGAKSHVGRALKRYWKLLSQDQTKVDYQHFRRRRNFRYAALTDSEVINRLLEMDPTLAATYAYYQELLFCVHHRDAERFKQLIAVPLQRLPEALKRVQRTFRKHAAEIIASFKCQLSNGPVEGINNKIKVIKRVAYGYRNFDHFRGRILLSCRNEYIDFDHLNTQKIA